MLNEKVKHNYYKLLDNLGDLLIFIIDYNQLLKNTNLSNGYVKLRRQICKKLNVLNKEIHINEVCVLFLILFYLYSSWQIIEALYWNHKKNLTINLVYIGIRKYNLISIIIYQLN